MKWHEVAPYLIRGMENDTAVGHILINMKKWDALPDDLKEALKGAAKDYWNITFEAYQKETQVVENMVKTGEVKKCQLDEDCIKKHAEAAYELWNELAAKDEASAEAIKLIKEWRGIK
jgi:TRAP-type mannitol/chloroaromatic compound transport system substrate-binding protein